MNVPAHRQERFANCGAATRVKVHMPTGRPLIVCERCRDRACHPCQVSRGRMIAGNLRRKLDRRNFLHVVLTLRSSARPLHEQVQHMLAGFRELRHQKFWMGRPRTIADRLQRLAAPPTFPWSKRRRFNKRRWRKAWRRCWFRWNRWTSGGCYFIEVTLNDKTGLWHPHLHVIAEASFIPHGFLSRAWESVTLDSPNVWIERVDDPNAVAAEVSKYVSKPLKRSIFESIDRTQELLTAWRGLRLCSTFGRWRGFKLTHSETSLKREDLRDMGPLEQIMAAAQDGDLWARRTLAIIFDREPKPGQRRRRKSLKRRVAERAQRLLPGMRDYVRPDRRPGSRIHAAGMPTR